MLIAHPVAGKAKSGRLCEAFVAGAPKKAKGHVFYGVDASNWETWHKVQASREPYWYIDNAFFDCTRGTHFRVGRNCLQRSGWAQLADIADWRQLGDTCHTGSSRDRLAPLRLECKPFGEPRRSRVVVVVEQSRYFMQLAAGVKDPDMWLATVRQEVARQRFSPVIREWSSDKPKLQASLPAMLASAHSLVTWSSAAAVTAIVEGVPVVSMGEGVAERFSGSIAHLDRPVIPTETERHQWLRLLARSQWTPDEMRHGLAWQMLHEGDTVPCL